MRDAVDTTEDRVSLAFSGPPRHAATAVVTCQLSTGVPLPLVLLPLQVALTKPLDAEESQTTALHPVARALAGETTPMQACGPGQDTKPSAGGTTARSLASRSA